MKIILPVNSYSNEYTNQLSKIATVHVEVNITQALYFKKLRNFVNQKGNENVDYIISRYTHIKLFDADSKEIHEDYNPRIAVDSNSFHIRIFDSGYNEYAETEGYLISKMLKEVSENTNKSYV
jgi:hypothetical protein